MKRTARNIFALVFLVLICGFAIASFADDDFDDDEREMHFFDYRDREEENGDRNDGSDANQAIEPAAPVEQQTIQAPVSIAQEMDKFLAVDDKDSNGIDDAFENAR